MAYKYAHTAKGKDGKQTAGYRIEFIPHSPSGAPEKPKATLWFPGLSNDEASRILAHVEHMLEQLAANELFEKSTTAWLRQLTDKDHAKFAKYGFCNPRKKTKPEKEKPVRVHTLADLFREFKKTIGDLKPATQTKAIQAMDCLKLYFGESTPLTSLTAGSAKQWRVWLLTEGNRREGKKRIDKTGKVIQGRRELAENTVRKRSCDAKRIFKFAVELEWIQKNPFKNLVANVTANTERQYFVDRETIVKAIEAAPDEHWKGIIAIARFGGLRIPSELAGLRWMDIDFEAGRIRIHSPKTEHHPGKGVRWCPIFPELRPYLQTLADIAKPGLDTPLSAPVFPGCEKATNLRTQFERILKIAGIEKWPKLFQNLRASCETELIETFGLKDASEWIGHTQAVAMKHYAMATDKMFQRATMELSGIDPQRIDVSENRKKNRKNLTPPSPTTESRRESTIEKPRENTGFQAQVGRGGLKQNSGEWAVLDSNTIENPGESKRIFDGFPSRKENRKTPIENVEPSLVQNQILELFKNVSPEQSKRILDAIQNVLNSENVSSDATVGEAVHLSIEEYDAHIEQMALAGKYFSSLDQPPQSPPRRNRTP